MRVHAPTQENDESGGERWIPLFRELVPLLEEAFEHAEAGAVHFITRYRDTSANLRTGLNRIRRRAGLENWERPWHNLSATRHTELSAEFPLHVVCARMGNMLDVAAEYIQVKKEDLQRGAKSGAVAVHFPLQQVAAPTRTEAPEMQKTPVEPGFMLRTATACEKVRSDQLPPRGLETIDENVLKDKDLRQAPLSSAAFSQAAGPGTASQGAAIDPDLQRLIQAWPALADHIKAALLALLPPSL
jgi:hypothetical protein